MVLCRLYGFPNIQLARKFLDQLSVVAQIGKHALSGVVVLPYRLDYPIGCLGLIGAVRLIFGKISQTGASRCSGRDVVFTRLGVFLRIAFQEKIAVARNLYGVCLLHRISGSALFVVLTLVVVRGVAAGIDGILFRMGTCFIRVQDLVLLKVVEVVGGCRREVGICADAFRTPIGRLLVVLVGIERHLTVFVGIFGNISLHRFIRSLQLLLCRCLQAHVIEESKWISVIDGNLIVLGNFIVSQRDQVGRNLYGHLVSRRQCGRRIGFLYGNLDISQISRRIYVIRVRDLLFKGVGYLSGVSFLGHILFCVVVLVLCVQQGIQIIYLHVVPQLIHQSHVAALRRIRTGFHFRRRLGRRDDFFLNFIEDVIQLRSLGCGLVEGGRLSGRIRGTGAQIVVRGRVRIVAGHAVHVLVELVFGAVGIRILEHADRVYGGAILDGLRRLNRRIGYAFVKTALVIRLTVGKEDDDALHVLAVRIGGLVSLALGHLLLGLIHGVIRCGGTCRFQRIDRILQLRLVVVGIRFIVTYNLSVVVMLTIWSKKRILFLVGVISYFVGFFARELHQRNPAAQVLVGPLAVGLCRLVNKRVHRRLQGAHFIVGIHTSGYVQHHYDVQRNGGLSHDLRRGRQCGQTYQEVGIPLLLYGLRSGIILLLHHNVSGRYGLVRPNPPDILCGVINCNRIVPVADGYIVCHGTGCRGHCCSGHSKQDGHGHQKRHDPGNSFSLTKIAYHFSPFLILPCNPQGRMISGRCSVILRTCRPFMHYISMIIYFIITVRIEGVLKRVLFCLLNHRYIIYNHLFMLISDTFGLDAVPAGSHRKRLICSPLKDIIFYRDARRNSAPLKVFRV